MAVGEDRGAVEAVELPPTPPDTAPLAQQTLAYGLSGLLVPLAGMITLPVFARELTQGQYGVLELATTTSSVALTLTDVGMLSATLRSFYDYRDDEEPERRNLVRTGFLTTTTVALTVALLMIAFRDRLSQTIFGHRGLEAIVVLSAFVVLALNIWRYTSEVMRIRRQAFWYLAWSMIAAAVGTGLSVFGVLVLDWKVKGVITAGLIAAAISALGGLTVIWPSLAGRFSRSHLRRMLAFGLPLVPATVAAWALALVDRIILARLGTLSQVGQYAIANRLAMLLTLGMTAFLFALTPFLFSLFADDPEQEKAARGRTLTYLTFLLSLGALALTLFAKEAVHILAPAFGEAYKAVGPLALGMVFYGLSSVLATGLALARTTVRGAILTLTGAAINIGLNVLLIPPYGIVGAGIATAVGYGFLAFSYYLFAQYVYPTPYEPVKVVTTLGVACVLGTLGFVSFGSEGVAVVVKLAALVAFLAGVQLTGAITRTELRELLRFMVAMIPPPLRRARARA